jgi:hypothetical protein
LHYLNGEIGVKDFDIWSFYVQYDDWPFPDRWRGTRDFGPSKFGRYPVTRRVTLAGALIFLGARFRPHPGPTRQMPSDATSPPAD